MNVEVNGNALIEEIESLMMYVASAYRIKGERNGLAIAGNPDKIDLSNYDEKFDKMYHEIKIRLDSIRRELDGEDC